MREAPAIRDRRCKSLPPEFQLRGATGYARPMFPRGIGAHIAVVADQLLQNEWRDRPEIERRQLEQVRALLCFAKRQSPFYARRIGKCGLNPWVMKSLVALRRLPLLTRRDLQDHFDDIKARQLPEGTHEAGVGTTAGSTAAPVRVLATNVSQLMWHACMARSEVWAGVDMRRCTAVIRHFDDGPSGIFTSHGLDIADWGGVTAEAFVTGPSHAMDIGQDLEAQLSFIVRVNPHYLLSYPTNLAALGRMLSERGVRLSRLQVVQTIGELLAADVRQVIETAFGAPVTDLYSCVEAGYVASDCPAGHGYHVHEESVLLEILDEQGGPCAPGQCGKVVLTALTNYASPIIRYDVGDYATLAAGPCPCGRNLLRLSEIVGRQRGQVLMPDGRLRYSGHLLKVIRQTEAVRQFQVVQHEAARFEVRIVPMEHFGAQHRRAITEHFHSFLGFPAEVSFTVLPGIERTRGGKYLDFICEAT